MATELVIEERVLGIFEAHKERGLMAEEVFPLYEEAYGDTSRSNSIHTTISRLTKKGFLFVVRKATSPLTHKTVNVWQFNDGTVTAQAAIQTSRPSNKQVQEELNILRLKNKQLEEVNMKLLGDIENLRNEVQSFVEKAAGASL